MQNETAKENLLRQIREYRPYNEQEERIEDSAENGWRADAIF